MSLLWCTITADSLRWNLPSLLFLRRLYYGPQFTSEHFTKYLEENGIAHRRTTSLWPQANGEIERQNRSILKRLRIAQAEGRNWKSEIDNFLVIYRSTPHSTTGVSPAQLLFGTLIRTKLPHLQEFSIEDEVRDRDNERKEKEKVCHLTSRKSQKITI